MSALRIILAILNFSEAFDTLSHQKLLHKLDAYGIRGPTLSWIASSLTQRKMCLVVEGEKSRQVDVGSEVPQASVLGPVLFLCHINGVPDRVKSKIRLFADDCLLYRPTDSPKYHQILQ